jgi:Type III restriction enzyme, res subunit
MVAFHDLRAIGLSDHFSVPNGLDHGGPAIFSPVVLYVERNTPPRAPPCSSLRCDIRGSRCISVTSYPLAKSHLKDGKRVAFVTPRISLIEQTCRAFERQEMTDYGVIQGKHYRTNSSAPLQICCAQTLAVRRVRPTADIVFIDECHWQSKFLIKWISDEKWRDVPFIGLSATPWSSGMGKH